MSNQIFISYHGKKLKKYLDELSTTTEKLSSTNQILSFPIFIVIHKNHLPKITSFVLLKIIKELSVRDDWDVFYLSSLEDPIDTQYIDSDTINIASLDIMKIAHEHASKNLSYISKSKIKSGQHVIALFPEKSLFYSDYCNENHPIISVGWYIFAIIITVILLYLLHYRYKKIYNRAGL